METGWQAQFVHFYSNNEKRKKFSSSWSQPLITSLALFGHQQHPCLSCQHANASPVSLSFTQSYCDQHPLLNKTTLLVTLHFRDFREIILEEITVIVVAKKSNLPLVKLH